MNVLYQDQLTVEQWFRDNWTKMEDKGITIFLLKYCDILSESTVREFKDYFPTNDDVIFKVSDNIDFIRELVSTGCTYWVNGFKLTEKQVEEFRDRVNWYEVFQNNFIISEQFIDKWSDKVENIEFVRKRRYEKMEWDPECRRKMKEEIQRLKDQEYDAFYYL